MYKTFKHFSEIEIPEDHAIIADNKSYSAIFQYDIIHFYR